MYTQPTSATAAKDRLYGQLSASLGRLNRSITRTADLLEELEKELHSMSMFAALDAAKFMAIASGLNTDEDPEGERTADASK
ncbi:hypothetical protein BDZ89DRAFT_978436 [Hymenopellis radicata]|nr:hypothetical protein BDZ89DRAFT_978436 [Hymenopellis radicata]